MAKKFKPKKRISLARIVKEEKEDGKEEEGNDSKNVDIFERPGTKKVTVK